MGPARAAVLLLAAAAALSCAAPIREQGWVRVRTAHHELISSATPAVTRRLALGLEEFRAASFEVMSLGDRRSRHPALVYVFGDEATYARFRPRAEVPGFFLPAPWRNYLAIDASSGEKALPIVRHEFVHYILHALGSHSYPPWYDEGLCEVLSTLEVIDGRLALGRVPPGRVQWLTLGQPLSLRRMLTAREILTWKAGTLATFYAQAWALTHFLHFGHLLGGPDRYPAMLRYLEAVSGGGDPELVFAEAFGETIREVERDYLTYVGEGRIPYRELDPVSFPERIETHSLPEVEKLYLLGELALARGEDALADSLLSDAVQLAPSDPAALSALAMARAARGGSDVEALLERAAAGPRDERTELWMAQAALRLGRTPGGGAAAQLQIARSGFRRMLAANPDDVAALIGLGSSYRDAEGDLDEGVRALESARALRPRDSQLALALSDLYLKQGRVDEARELLARAPPPGHGVDLDTTAVEALLRRAGFDAASSSAVLLEPQLEVSEPIDHTELEGLLNVVEVKGRAGLGELLAHDLVIVLDESNSTLIASGTDLDGDGRIVGRRSPNVSGKDARDSILGAELLAARELVSRLNPDETRVSLLTFATHAKLRAPLGPPSATLEALDAYELYFDPMGTSLAVALWGAADAFLSAPPTGELRRRSVILLSDGTPTVPDLLRGRRDALRMAEFLGKFGIRVFAFALGKEAVGDPRTYQGIAEHSGGQLIELEHPGEIVEHLARVRLSGLDAVEIRNATTGIPGRATRVFADGSFDAYVALAPGLNQIEVVARLESGQELVDRRWVHFGTPGQPTDAHEAAAAALRERMRLRTLETELAIRAGRDRDPEAAPERELAIEVDAAPAAP